ncbi:cyclic nucleotide-binding domain containing protein [Tritrichomonas foetus]|uniref:Cyclic nucleotide-binding domain containing protein n=1 Tax=Tritrichomonas foetus TaxID=1144522 RepID=A0A1J4KBP8_9EUKA|nr:cyclic nucleotide-binding domain containing protein [Tritrichomonas foetus]|eukprot:OHT07110.1 cyclic nucleotide-binding domain containing protein [Tritrichomonas foetus]
MSHTALSRRLRPKVILVSRKKMSENQNVPTQDDFIKALNVTPSERTQQDIDTIMAIVGKWGDFQKFIHTEQERREVCRRIAYEKYDVNDIVVKQYDEPDGWYLIYTGKCSIYVTVGSDFGHENIPPSVISTLRNALGQDKCFLNVAQKFPSQEFGSTALTKNDVRNASILCDEPSLILRVDPHLYRDTAAWFARTQLEKKATLLSHIPQLQFLRELPPEDAIFTRLAENMIGQKLEINTVIDPLNPLAEGFIVIEEGLMAKQRSVDFSTFKRRDQQGQIKISVTIPTGKHTVRVVTLGPKMMVPDPGQKEYVSYPFSLVVLEPVQCYILKTSDLSSMLLSTHLEKIKSAFRAEPTDNEVIKMYIDKQEAIHWQLFKKKCVKEAREIVKIEKAIMNGQWAIRKPGIPKRIKDHKSLPPMRRDAYESYK